MKRIIITMIMLVAFGAFISGCGDKSTSIKTNTPPYSGATVSEKDQKEMPNSTTYTELSGDNIKQAREGQNNSQKVKPLEGADFSVSDSKNSIGLDTSFKGFKIDKPEENLDNNYVGELNSGDFVYKYFMHRYSDIDLYVSNANYNLKNRDFNDYHITQITLRNSNFKTARGITIGSTLKDVQGSYDQGHITSADGKRMVIYRLNDKEMAFTIGENQTVQDVTLRIVVEGAP